MATREIDLEYREGSSDKVYRASLAPKGKGFIVSVAWGRRGAALQSAVKTPKPVPEEQALKIFNKLVAEKTGKGYRPIKGTTIPVQEIPTTPRVINPIALMGLYPIQASRVEHFLADDRWIGEPKYDGKRICLRLHGDTVVAQNRLQKACTFPAPIGEALRALRTRGATKLSVDGELIGDTFYAFDLIEANDLMLNDWAYRDRRQMLAQWVGATGPLQLGAWALGSQQKTLLFQRLTDDRHEGIVFKLFNGAYKAGKHESLAVKFKFWADCAGLVIARNDTGAAAKTTAVSKVKLKSGKRSVQVALTGPKGEVVNVGDVAIPANYEMPSIGALVQVRYLYAYEKSKKLFQPQYEGVRDDVATPDLTTTLKFKNEGTNEDDEE